MTYYINTNSITITENRDPSIFTVVAHLTNTNPVKDVNAIWTTVTASYNVNEKRTISDIIVTEYEKYLKAQLASVDRLNIITTKITTALSDTKSILQPYTPEES